MMKFRMLDRILAWDACRTICGIKAVSFEECQLRESLGYESYLPESLILESLFQSANWLVILSTDYAQASLGAQLDEAQFLAPLKPGARLHLDIVVRGWRDDSAIVDGSVSDGRQTIAIVSRCLVAFVPLADHYDPGDMRALFSEIYRPDATDRPEESRPIGHDHPRNAAKGKPH